MALLTWTTFDMRDAIEASYLEQCPRAALSARFAGVDSRRVLALVRQLPPDLTKSDTSLSLRRAANALTGVSERREYTDAELRQALVDCLGEKGLSYPAASARYGPGVSTLKRHAAALRLQLPEGAGQSQLEAAVAELAFLVPRCWRPAHAAPRRAQGSPGQGCARKRRRRRQQPPGSAPTTPTTTTPTTDPGSAWQRSPLTLQDLSRSRCHQRGCYVTN